MCINLACLGRVGAVFRLHSHGLASFTSVPETRHLLVDHHFKVGTSGCGVSQLYSLTAVTYGCSGSNGECRGVPSTGGY